MIIREFLSSEGIAAGLVCAFAPLAAIGYLIARHITDENYIYSIGYTMAGVILVYSISSILMMLTVKKLERQILTGGYTAPSRTLKIIYGAGLGMVFCLVVILILVLLSYFVF